MSEASKLKLKRWLEGEYDEDKEGTLDKIYKELCEVVSEIVEEDSRIVIGGLYDKLSTQYTEQSKKIKERAQKRLKEEQKK